ncbi:MAG: gliding motility-associated C-terminal domain-containing protein [Bacteroidetes bacterium]|nr:gliding motility-associated C-terminal domain-containing protein [Bacteroidota bacterium]
MKNTPNACADTASGWVQEMKRRISYAVAVALLLPIGAMAQYTTLLDLGGTANGANPCGTPITVGTYLYGMTTAGGASNNGTIYKIKTDGTGFTKVFDFNGTNGSQPNGSLYSDGTYLYGMTSHGGANGNGLIFRIKPDGSGYSDLLDFSYSSNGGYPNGSLISDGTYLYGMTTQGGPSGAGTIFKIKADGSGYTNLLNFTGTNGGYPYGDLLLSGSALYGMTSQGGASSGGTLFTINTDGTGFNTYYNFSSGSSPRGSLITDGTYLYGLTYRGGNNNYGELFKFKLDGSGTITDLFDFDISTSGAYPLGTLTFDGTSFYGMTTQSVGHNGTIFKVGTDGTGFTKLLDVDLYANGSGSQGTLLWDGSTTLYGVRSGINTNFSGLGYIGALFKINTDGSNYTSLFNYEAGANTPESSFLAIGSTLYATSSNGGLYNYGTIFKVNQDGSGFSKVVDFDGPTRGRNPQGRLIYDGTYLYGTTTQGGASGNGTVFKVKPDGTGFVDLLDFDGTNSGSNAHGALLYDGTYLYGMTPNGGASSYGTIFKLLPDGTGYTKLADLNYSTTGAYPYGSLISVSNVLYGVANGGGTNDAGTLFKLNKDGSNFTVLVNFDYTNSGASPYEGLYFDGTFLYGTTSSSGANGYGTIFKVKTDGTGFATLMAFDGTNTGGGPKGPLLSDDGVTLFGMTSGGGSLGYGTAFSMKTDGTNFTKLFDFDYGTYPQGSFVSDGTYLYGLTEQGGVNSVGTVFKISKAPFVSVTSFNPGIGAPGTVVTITGTNFSPIAVANVVKFNNVIATIKSCTTTTIVAVVPTGATTGPISVTAGTTGVSVTDFTIVSQPEMIDGNVQSCNFQFVEPSGTSDLVETFSPVNAGDKVKVSFSSFNAPDDQLKVYDGPTTSSPLIITLNGTSLPADIVATSATGELTFQYIWADGFASSWLANISCQSTAPTISIDYQPQDYTACSGDPATFTASASGTTNIAYQWQYSVDGVAPFADLSNSTHYSNVTTLTLTVNTAGSFGAGRYRCKISGDLATTVYTNDGGLFINPVPTSPTVTNASSCGPAALTLSASGGSNGNYIWYDGSGVISGQTNSTYTTPNLTLTTQYSVAITNGNCTSPQVNVTATINSIPATPTTQGVTACPGSTFTLTASGGANGQFVWYTTPSGGTPINGQVNSSYTTPALTATTTYYVSVNNGFCEGARAPVVATVSTSGCPGPVIAATPLTTQLGGVITLNLVPLISTSNSTLDINSITITVQPSSGAEATVSNGVLTINYNGVSFSGNDQLTIRACDTYGNCSTKDFAITVAGDIVVYNGLSPNGKNPAFIIEYIDLLPETKNNTVYIFDRWENQVWQGTNYNNTSVVFTGVSEGGSDLPSGVYFYKINFASGRKTMTGFISLRRQ